MYNSFLTLHTLKKCLKETGTSLAVQWLRLCTPNAGSVGLIPGWGTRSCVLHSMAKQKKFFKGNIVSYHSMILANSFSKC